MNSFPTPILIALLSLFSSHAFAEPQELLVPVTDSEGAIAEASNEYFLKKETYFAKQYRIVKVNTDVLVNAEQIRISLFDGLSVTLEVSSVDVHPEGFEILWRGRFIEPSGVSIDELVAGGMSRKGAEKVASQLNSLTIGAAQVSYDENARLKYGHHFPRFSEFRSASRRFSLDGQSPIYEVGFYIHRVVLPKVYELRPLASDPQYHVLIELDPDKIYAIPIERPDPNDPAGFVETPENKAKRQRHLDFLNSLGPDPRPPDFHTERR